MVHGFMGSPLELLPLKLRLARSGFDVIIWSHATLNRGIAGHSAEFKRCLESQVTPARWDTVHFVGHSMGAVIVRGVVSMMFQYPMSPLCAVLGRAVLLTPPNRGSRVATAMPDLIKQTIPAVGDLSDDPRSYVNSLPESMPIEAGVMWTKKDHLVAPSSALIPVSGGAVEVDGFHSGILYSPRVAALTSHFLRSGSFS